MNRVACDASYHIQRYVLLMIDKITRRGSSIKGLFHPLYEGNIGRPVRSSDIKIRRGNLCYAQRAFYLEENKACAIFKTVLIEERQTCATHTAFIIEKKENQHRIITITIHTLKLYKSLAPYRRQEFLQPKE